MKKLLIIASLMTTGVACASDTFWRDTYTKAIETNKLIEEKFGDKCTAKEHDRIKGLLFDDMCLWIAGVGTGDRYTRANQMAVLKADAMAEPLRVEEQKKYEAEVARLAKLPGVSIGMSSNQVLKRTSWGKPNSINQTITSHGTREQWVYGSSTIREYLYFQNGILVSIQTSR